MSASTFENAFKRVQELVETFKSNEKYYTSQAYQEAEARRDFIDKFLTALGWDVNHDTQKNPYEQEVKVERKEHGVSQRRADYAFYIKPNFRDVKFYIEAKKPFGDIATADNYFQTIRYGWNSKTPIAALFDFEQFEVVDCRFKPNLETALQRSLKKFHFSQYADEKAFAEIYWLFSREAIAGGSLEKYAETLPKKRGAVQRGLLKGGYQSIDDAFLEELDEHRETLAHIFKNDNPQLDSETLTEITQRTLDRLVFIRFLEDKLIEPQYLVSKFGEGGSAWNDFISTSRRLDGIYNGIVFKKNGILDSPEFKIDDDQFSGICEDLCHINSPYDFNAIPIHILGSIYERFLGKVIIATAKRAKVEQKPEVRNAGGVFYTPEYIVRYIVENTVGKLIEGKTPAQIAELRFADIACGSGSFLLGVYDLLIRHHTKFYNENPGKVKKGDTVQREDGIHLSLQKKREILLKNIYGVDIDAQAVEVAQLSLYLKLLQDETPASARDYQMEFTETLLPSLAKNIVCGNSLIGTDILSGELFEPIVERKLNPMDFTQRFPEIFKRGGFDVIVGNPPYGADFSDLEKNYYQSHYIYKKGKPETYVYFLERSISLLRSGAILGYITPNAWLTNYYGIQIRRHILNETKIEQLVDLEPTKVFEGAVVDTAISIISKSPVSSNKADIYRGTKDHKIIPYCKLDQSFWKNDSEMVINLQANPDELGLIKRIESSDETIDKFLEYSQGVIPYKTKADGAANRYIRPKPQSKEWLPLLESAAQVQRYFTEEPRSYIHYGSWLWCAREPRFFSEPKLLFHRLRKKMARQLVVSLDETGAVNRHSLSNLILRPNVPKRTIYAMLGLLNSTLANWWFVKRYGLLMEVGGFKISRLPLPKELHTHSEQLIVLVEQMLEARIKLNASQSDKDKDYYGNKCATLDRQIDALVYKLYDLTPEEIKIVEST